VSGALAERIHIDAYVAYSLIMTAIIYPIGAGWAWGDGWLQQLGYHDFSGSGVVHLVGGVAGLVGTWICGPRLGIMGKHMKSTPIENNKFPNISLRT
jgi:Amt family ammonium transporter